MSDPLARSPLGDPLVPFHAGYMVPDLDAAVGPFGAALGVEFMEPHEVRGEAVFDGSPMSGDSRFTFSIGAPGGFRIELVEPLDRSGWASLPGGPFLHHVGSWVDDYAAAERRLLDAGFVAVVVPAGDAPALFGYFQDSTRSVTVEICSRELRPRLEHWFGPFQ